MDRIAFELESSLRLIRKFDRGFTQNITGANEIHLKGNRLNLIGKYVLHGKILILPVVGNGDANVTICKS